MDALPGLIQSLHCATALGSGLAAPKPHPGLASACGGTAHPADQEDHRQEGDGAQARPQPGNSGGRSQCEESGGDHSEAHGKIIETVFVTDHGLDAHRYRHLKRIAKKQWQSGKPIKGEHSNQQLWRHVDRLNEDVAHKVARRIAAVCAKYPGCILLFERLRKIKPGPGQ